VKIMPEERTGVYEQLRIQTPGNWSWRRPRSYMGREPVDREREGERERERERERLLTSLFGSTINPEIILFEIFLSASCMVTLHLSVRVKRSGTWQVPQHASLELCKQAC
jgi:hypothetical protein